MTVPARGVDTPALRILGCAQGAFYAITGIWPLLSPYSFQVVTGFKEDFWLAQTVGALLAVTGAVLFSAGRARRITAEIALLGGGLAFVLGVVDVLCVAAPRTTRVYWLDAIAEFSLVIAWIVCWRRSSAKHARASHRGKAVTGY
jgi:hypothetical protein